MKFYPGDIVDVRATVSPRVANDPEYIVVDFGNGGPFAEVERAECRLVESGPLTIGMRARFTSPSLANLFSGRDVYIGGRTDDGATYFVTDHNDPHFWTTAAADELARND